MSRFTLTLFENVLGFFFLKKRMNFLNIDSVGAEMVVGSQSAHCLLKNLLLTIINLHIRLYMFLTLVYIT